MDMEVLASKIYSTYVYGISVSGEKVCIIGEQIVKFADGKIVEQYVYNILDYAAHNGKPFISLKANICIIKEEEKMIKFDIVDITTNEILATVEGKGLADIRFVELQKKNPNRKLWLKMASSKGGK